MPIYEYRCSNCGKTSEILVRTNKEPVHCLYCGSADLKKLISSPAGIVMKGGSAGFGPTEGCCGITNPCDNPKRCCQQ
jgi:putative FmdB family regulatory protein